MNKARDIYDIIPRIFDEIKVEGSVYHYTSITGFLLMMEDIQKKQCHIFPGHMKYQNDTNELVEGKKFLDDFLNDEKYENIVGNLKFLNNVNEKYKNMKPSEIIEDLEVYNQNIYISCFSSNRDLLEQWKYYGKSCGLSIEFNFQECEGFFSMDNNLVIETSTNYKHICKKNNKEIKDDDVFHRNTKKLHIEREEFNKTIGGITLQPIKVLYEHPEEDNGITKQTLLTKVICDNEENIKYLGWVIHDLNRQKYIKSSLSAFIPICKNHYFSHEHESRLLFFPISDMKIKYREKNNRILPYLKCTIINKNPNKFPIKSITVGPGQNQNLIMNSVINIIDGEKCVFFSDEEMNNVNAFDNEELLRQNLKPGELSAYYNEHHEKVIVYNTHCNILIYKSPIPFRD